MGTDSKSILKWAIAAVVLLIAFWAFQTYAHAADLGGKDGLPDLEERIAELEATVARKGTRKVSVIISGQVNKAVLWWDEDEEGYSDSDARVIENGASESYVSISGAALIRPGLWAGYTVDFDLGESSAGYTENDISNRQSFVFLKSDDLGTLSIGNQSTATDDLTQQNVARTDAATKRLTLQPVIGEESEIFNGYKTNAIKYTSRTIAGFQASAAWDSDGDAWDAKLSFAGEGAGFVLVAAVGYLDRNEDGILEVVDSRTLTLNAGVKHVVTGLFVQASWARIDDGEFSTYWGPGEGEYDAFHVQGGIERKLFEGAGPTTIWAEYADWGYDEVVHCEECELPYYTAGSDLKVYGIGINQNLAGSVDLYALYRRYDFDTSGESEIETENGTIDTIMGGVRIGF
jgi:hypothetical protein